MTLKKMAGFSFLVLNFGCVTNAYQHDNKYIVANTEELSALLATNNVIGQKVKITGPVSLARNNQVLYLQGEDNASAGCIQLLMPSEDFKRVSRSGRIYRGNANIWGQLQYRPEIADALKRDSDDEIIFSINLENDIEVNRVVCR
ncbi:MAG: hypothetical protein AAFR69_11575, partial [Pseudomonadota bacterium]